MEVDASVASGDDVRTVDLNDAADGDDVGSEEPSTGPDPIPIDANGSETIHKPSTHDEPLTDDQGRKIRLYYSDGDAEEEEEKTLDDLPPPKKNQHGRYDFRKRSTLRSVHDRWRRRETRWLSPRCQ